MGGHDVREEAEGTGLLQPSEEVLRTIKLLSSTTGKEGHNEDGARLTSLVHSRKTRGSSHRETVIAHQKNNC